MSACEKCQKVQQIWASDSQKDPYSVLFTSDPLLLEAHIEGAVQELLIVGATVQHDWQADLGWDACTGCVQC